MPLIDITGKKDSRVCPNKSEKFEVIQALKRKNHGTTFDRMVKTVDEAIDSIGPSKISDLIWLRMASLFGHKTLQPKKHVDHLWDNVIRAVGDDKECLIAVGALLRWRISLRPETWLVYRQDTGEYDKLTGKKITVSEYWINEGYNKVNTNSINKLAEVWGARL